jgi:hypothetical protein
MTCHFRGGLNVLEIEKMCSDSWGSARYSEHLETLVNRFHGVEVLRLEFEANYQGHVDIDVLLSDGRVLSYEYWYGSCSGCDEWESRDLSDEEIVSTMEQEATIFDNLEQYNEWIKKTEKH